MSYQALARKWRPRDFATTVGQDHVVRALSNALEQKRLHHAYLFTGTRGVGKTTLARILAKALNCTGPDGSGGITATPCNRCEVCTAIDAGRFIDYIEMDAASNRSVDEMTALLERAVYAPSNARFKVYMIDEVHMLTSHAFNAMLKTLEEPPDYVKFILATTDPQKIPVTVLSRCLQFNLKQMTPAAIAGRLNEILGLEKIDAEPAAVQMLSRAARGSMRDGLSLLDQAIAYSGGTVTLSTVQAMLGAIDGLTLVRLLDALAAADAPKMLAIADDMAARSFSFGQALRDLAALLHRIALAQQADVVGEDVDNAAEIRRLAEVFSPEEVQLCYQIALHGRNDLALAPDEYAGFTMALLRMLAFAPRDGVTAQAATTDAAPRAAPPAVAGRAARPTAEPPRGAAQAKAAGGGPIAAARMAAPPLPAPGDWPQLVNALQLAGLARELASHSELLSVDGDLFRLRVAIKSYAESANVERLRAALTQHFGRPIRVAVEVGSTAGATTAASLAEQARSERQKNAEQAILSDPFVQELIENFGAQVEPQSIRPRES
ncbi:MAG: DNA polymerase III subunit gamma/tau [Burkholderiales bacterium]|nr:DNA polymerase III subunit gamma/tau [Burkholderiales bacterium]